ncbi:uncharacterized protein A4U43_C04F25230 [Asparagus officinalis]|uniref:Uncharacterized protein n=1 Tax=Asparagus officinalis TaxID=4686 RepID=A0A5P1F3I3_ASPOF|nr:uncharacterized protein A4U43_C04F25230 [Asparagus officinalis]
MGEDEVYLIKTLRVGPRYVRESNLDHRHEPAHHLDIRGTVLGVSRCRSPPKPLVRGALVESEIYGRMEQVRTSYLKLLREVTSLRAEKRFDSEGAAEMPILGASKVDNLREKLE